MSKNGHYVYFLLASECDKVGIQLHMPMKLGRLEESHSISLPHLSKLLADNFSLFVDVFSVDWFIFFIVTYHIIFLFNLIFV